MWAISHAKDREVRSHLPCFRPRQRFFKSLFISKSLANGVVITSNVFADFRFESPISIDFQNEILALLPPKPAKTFHESLQILSPQSWKVFADFVGKSYTKENALKTQRYQL